jgi:hypothetical protein
MPHRDIHAVKANESPPSAGFSLPAFRCRLSTADFFVTTPHRETT